MFMFLFGLTVGAGLPLLADLTAYLRKRLGE